MPALQRPAAQIGCIALAERLFLEADTARRVTCAAVTEPLNQIGTAIPLGAALRIRLINTVFAKDQIPQCQRPTDAERPGNVAFPIRLRHCADLLREIQIKIADIVIVDFGKRRVGHGRVQPPAVARDAFAKRIGELGQAVPADTGLAIGRDVGGVNSADRRGHLQATCEEGAAGRGVAGRAIPCACQIFTVFNSRRGREGVGRLNRTCGEQQQHRQCGCKSFHLELLRRYACTSGPGFFRYCSRIASAE